MELKSKIVAMSHLSDAEENILMGNEEMAFKHIKFAKFLIMESLGDLNKVFSEDKLNEMWKQING
jgi:hypothetical protein